MRMFIILTLFIIFVLWFGFYVGIVGGIVTIAKAVKSDPVSAGGVLWGSLKFFGCPSLCKALSDALWK